MKELLRDWHNWIPLAGLAALALVGIIFWLRRKPVDPGEIERQRRAFLNRVGRIVEGQVLEIVDHARDSHAEKPAAVLAEKQTSIARCCGQRHAKTSLLHLLNFRHHLRNRPGRDGS